MIVTSRSLDCCV